MNINIAFEFQSLAGRIGVNQTNTPMGFNIFTISNDRLNIARVVAGGLYIVWVFVLVILWGVVKKDDGDRQDLVYPLYTPFASWTDPDYVDTKTYGDFYELCQKYVGDVQCRRPRTFCDQPKALEFSAHQTVTPAFKDSGITLSLHGIVVLIFSASAFFQIMAIIVSTNKNLLVPTVRFFEYSITAPLMIVGIALQLGIMQTYTLILLATLSWACMICVLCCEKIRLAKATVVDKLKTMKKDISDKQYVAELKTINELRKVILIAQGVGWVMLGITFYVLISSFQDSQGTCDSPEKAPNFIWAILYGELLFFASFCFMQILEIVGAVSAEQADLAYIMLSFSSNSYLGWMIYGGNFVQA